VVALGHELGKKVVAEGVETAEDAAFLRSIGCELAQGFYYGEPMPDRDVLHLLRLVRKADRRMRRRGWVRGQAKKKTGEGDATAPRTAPPLAARLRQGSAPAPAHRPQANGHDRSQPTTVRTGPPSQPAARARQQTQPVTQPPAVPAALQKGRMRSAAANARARLAGLAGQAAYRPPEPPSEPPLRTLPRAPLRQAGPPVEDGMLPMPRSAGGPPTGRPPPLPHQMLPSDKPRPAASPQAQAQAQARTAARPRTQPANLDALPPQIKASLEKLAGGPVHLERPSPVSDDDPPTTEKGERGGVLGLRKRKAST
jgi:EAL domain